MKFHLNSNIVEGTPAELVKYQELLEDKEKEKEKEKVLFPFAHEHQLTEEEKQVTFQGILGSLKIDNSYVGSTESSTEEEDVEVEPPTELQVGDREKIEEEDIMGYTFWYIDGTQSRNLNVLKATLDGDFEDSTGTRYTHQAVSGLIKPLDREDAREKFEEAKHYDCLLKYYPTVDVFAWK